MQTLIVDAGNTRIKIAKFINNEQVETYHFSTQEINKLKKFISSLTYDNAFISSVIDLSLTDLILKSLHHAFIFDENTLLPIQLDYDSRKTLGKDRLANAVASSTLFPQNNVLVIDVGTCIKFDFVSHESIYKGGSISPGIQMRFKSLNEHTGRLPLIEKWEKTKLIGNSSVDSIVSGVINGIKFEIEGMINAYKTEFKDLIIFATGGDFESINLNKKLGIIFDNDLTIKGLYTIYKNQHEN